ACLFFCLSLFQSLVPIFYLHSFPTRRSSDILYSFPYFWLLSQGSVLLLFVATIIGVGVIWAPITAVLGTMFSEIFDANVRYTGISLGYQIGAAVAGGTAPLIATFLLYKFNDSYIPVALYMIASAIISLIAISFVKDRTGQELDELVSEENKVS